ncbi:MAG: hypothetical protein CVU91_07275 [Firmicutes bacterium HGW-Firmicutes-16]|nr:MAG: hypothetical protein CVU91_07275 [Firmicutes bacterium HGW-Firmicutes-16]
MKKVLCLVLALSMSLVLVACGPKESAESVVKNAIESVKNMNVESMQSYWGDDQFKDVNSEESSAESDAESLAMMGLIVKNLDYEIMDANEEKDTATVKVQITNLDMSKLMSEFVSQALSEVLSYAFLSEDQQPSEEELNKKYMDMMTTLLDREDNPKVTNTVDITLTLVDNQWVITPNEDAVDAMLGGISSFSDAMNEASNGATGAEATSEKDKITEIRNWAVSDIWSAGFCDFSWYFSYGTNSVGDTMDPEFALQQLEKSMKQKPEYDTYMSSLPAEYSDISELWAKVSEQIDILYADVKSRELTVSGQVLDTGLYTQYFQAFDSAYNELP